MAVSILDRWSGEVIATVDDTDSVREAVIRLVRQGVSLRAANLSAANLRAADLRDANLRAADLSDANLSAADLSSANLRAANLSAADLSDANLSAADLSAANLSDANLSAADLSPIRDDFYAVLSFAPAEVPVLIAALDAGRVNGSAYSDGNCGCLIGTLAIAAGASPTDDVACSVVHGLRGNSGRPAEAFFLAIRKGDTPETSQHAKLARDWAAEWLDRMQAAFAQKAGAVA